MHPNKPDEETTVNRWVTKCSRMTLDAARPILRRLPRGAGTLYRAMGGYRDSRIWSESGTRAVKGVDHGYAMRLDMGNVFQRETYYLGRFYEWELQGLMKTTVKPGGLFIDVGANVGMITLWAAALVGREGRVLAFEPNPEPRALLEEHVRINRLEQVQILEYALGETPGTATLRTATEHTGTGTLRERDTCLKTVSVKVKTLDEWFPDLPEGCPLFVKIDTEGYDFKVLKGARKLLSRPDVTVFAEVNPKWLGELGESEGAMFDYMKDLGFDVFHPEIEQAGLRHRVKLRPLELPGPHDWYNAFFARTNNVDLKEMNGGIQ